MISDKFKKEILEHKKMLFYNSSGNTEAYKLCIKHISAAPYFKKGFKVDNDFIPYEGVYLVNFEKEEINYIEDRIKMIKIKELK